MKKWIVLCLVVLLGCMPKYTPTARIKDYGAQGALVLPATRLDMVSMVEQTQTLPHIEYRMPQTPEKALYNWAYIRLRTNQVRDLTARFIIEEASMIREDDPQRWPWQYDNYKYTLTWKVRLQLTDNKGFTPFESATQGFVMRTLPQKASVNETKALWVDMLDEMEALVNEKMSNDIADNLIDLSF